MSCKQCDAIGTTFDRAVAERSLARYRARGPDATTRVLIEALVDAGVRGADVLDIGAGVGAVGNGLLEAGARAVTAVDASPAYLAAARREARRQGHSDRVTHVPGDFVEIASRIPPADVVTLDRVICCYDDMEDLVAASAGRATRLYGLVYPRDVWWTRAVTALMNVGYRLRRRAFRGFVHPAREVARVVEAQGLRRRFRRRTLMWQVVVYGR